MKQVLLKELKRGDFFTMRPMEFPEDTRVWVKGEYDRSEKKYSCYRFSDVNYESFRKGTCKVWTDFTF